VLTRPASTSTALPLAPPSPTDDSGATTAARAQGGEGFDNERESPTEVIARTAREPYAVAMLARDDAEPVVLVVISAGECSRAQLFSEPRQGGAGFFGGLIVPRGDAAGNGAG